MKPTILALSVAVMLAGCSAPPTPPAPAPLVRTLKVGAGEMAVDAALRTYSGEVRARIETTLGFRTAGKIVERLVEPGSIVKPGQVLARLDPMDAGLQFAQADAQRALAAAELTRFKDLKARNYISASALDAKETAFKAAEAQAALARNQTAYTTLVADRAGVIGVVLAEPGQVVSAGQAVFRMAPDGEREIAIALPEGEVFGFKLGQAAEVQLWSGSGSNNESSKAGDANRKANTLAARLREISPVADPVTRTYSARVSLKDADPRLPLGMSATVRFPIAGEQGRMRVPLTALYQQGDQTAVWKLAQDGSVGLQIIKVAAYADQAAIVSEGLTAGDEIVAAGVNRLASGQKVRIAGPTR
jgi:multidrug efflux system membrane fusion protein